MREKVTVYKDMPFQVLPNYLHYTQGGTGGNTTVINSGGFSGSLPFYNVGDFSSLQAAVSSLGTRPSTLYISSGVTITSNLIIPRNIDLIFTNSGSITVSNGVTGVHLGGLDAPPHQIFFNVYSGQGAMNFYNPALQNLKIQKYYLPWWAGTGGYNGDSKSGIQAAIDSLYINSTIYAPFGCNYLIGSPISMYGKFGMNLIAENGYGYTNLGQPFSNFKWSGESGGTMLEMQHCSHCKIDGWGFDALNSVSGALICINMDGEGSPTSTQNTISNNYFRCSPLTGSIGVSLSKFAASNNEFMTFENNIFSQYGYHSGYGLYMGRSSNAHGHVFRNNNFFYFKHGIHMENGSFKMEGLNNFNSNEVDIWMDDTAYPTIIRGADSESSYQFAYINSHNNPVFIDSCRMQASGHSSDEALIKFGTQCRWVTVTNNTMSNIQTSTGYVYDGRSAASLLLFTANNSYATNYTDDKIYKELWHTNTSHISLDDGRIKGRLIARGKAGAADGEFPPFQFENTQSGNRFINLMLSKVTGALEWDYIRMYLTQSGLVRQPIAYTTDITGTNALFTGVNSIKVTGFSAQTGIISVSGIGTVTVLTGNNNFIYISGSSAAVSNNGDGINLSGNLYNTGSSLYNNIIGLSGVFNNTSKVTSINVTGFGAQTGNINISGLGSVTIFTGDNNYIYISGSQSQSSSSSNSDGINLSGNLTTTGQTLYNYILNLSGISERFFTGVGLVTSNSIPKFTSDLSGIINSNITDNGSLVSTTNFSGTNIMSKVITEVTGIIIRNPTTPARVHRIYSDSQGFHINSDSAERTYIGTAAKEILFLDNLGTNARYAVKANGGTSWGIDLGGSAAGESFHNLYIQNIIGTGNMTIINNANKTGIFISGRNTIFYDYIIASGLILSGTAPTSYNSAGTSGELALSGTNLYICTGQNAWGRIPILDF